MGNKTTSKPIPQTINIEEKYQDMDEIAHILAKPGMYIGSTYFETMESLLYKPSEERIIPVSAIAYNEGLLKLFNEVFQNSIDEHKRKSALYRVTEINVEVYRSGKIVIMDNGGIPVVVHKGRNMYVPKMLFGYLRTSSNYSEERTGAGTNGIGAKIANIFSSSFKLTTADGKNKIDLEWRNNMRDLVKEEVSGYDGHYSRFEFDIEMFRFDEAKEMDLSTTRLIHKQCIDGAASNPGLKITFKTDIAEQLNSEWCFKDFSEFVKLHLGKDDENSVKNMITHKFANNDSVIILPNIDVNHSFVNGATCNDLDGTQFKKVRKQINDYILSYLEKKDIKLITEKDINNKVSYFINFSMLNPDYASQTKSKLTSKLSTQHLTLPQTFLNQLDNSEIVKTIEDYYNVKYLAQVKKEIRNLNRKIKNTKSKKLTKCSSHNPAVKRLFLFEGTSASNGFRLFRNAETDASYELRGKVRNTLNLSREEILQNQEWCEILATLDLQFLSPKENLKMLKFHQIIIGADADVDGNHITGLILAFFCKHFPEVIKSGKLYRLITPIIIATHKKSKEEVWFYTMEEYNKAKELFGYNDGKSVLETEFNLDYKKGLGSLQDKHYRNLVQKSRLYRFTFADAQKYMERVNLWFGKSADMRKEELIYAGESIQIDTDF